MKRKRLIPLLLLLSCTALPARGSPPGPGRGEEAENPEEILDLSLEELLELPVEVTGSLTGATRRLNPSTVTTLTQEDIRNSGARDLDELLDIYVPNFERMLEYYEFRKNGLRGINSDRDDKYLILVNGRVMNEHTHYGAISERDLPTLTDIHHIDVIRGPGSALYGPGAVAMVINIVTENAMTFQGGEFTARAGAIQTFYSGEAKYGKKLDDDTGYYLYAGVTKYVGADLSNSPIELGHPATSTPHERQVRFQEAWRDQPKYKVHAQYTSGGFDAWVRYTRGGEYRAKLPWIPADFRRQGDGYQQLTLLARYDHELRDDFSLEYMLSFDMFDYEKAVYDTLYSHREDEYTGRVLARWAPSENHHLALGGEFSIEKFGKKSPGSPDEPPSEWTMDVYGFTPMPSWTTRMYSAMAEYQWTISDRFTAFLGGRADFHTFMWDMYSPRATLVYTPSERDTAKLIYARSVRTGQAADLKLSDLLADKDTRPERIDSVEMRYERQQTDHLWLASSLFYNNHDMTGYNFDKGYTTLLGNLETYGVELESIYKTESTKVVFSHGFTKLMDWAPQPGVSDVVSSEPYHYGSDLANWSSNITKVALHRKLSDALSLDTSLRVYWGYLGFKKWARWSEDMWGGSKMDKGQVKPTYFFDLGFQYDFSKQLSLRLDGHDLLGFISEDYNKRLYGWYMAGDTRSLPPSVSLSLTYRF